MGREKKRTSWSFRLVVTLGGVALLAFVYFFFCHCEGYEFSPDRFVRRHFSFYRVPGIGLRVSPIFRKSATSDLETYILGQPYFKASQSDQEPRWDVVEFRNFRTEWQGDAKFLCRLLDETNQEADLEWLPWSRSHTELAAVLWPDVIELARDDLYILIPELMSLARGASDPDDFQAKRNNFLIPRLRRLAESASDLGQTSSTVVIYSRLLALDPDDVPALRSRAAAYSELGKADKAEADRRRADEIEAASSS
jgi:tetratricopeptide (TPR) repeat protein